MNEIRVTSAWVASRSSHVKVDILGLETLVDSLHEALPKFVEDFRRNHFFDNGKLAVQYLLVLDALNFCFWPDENLSYDHLALSLNEALMNDKRALDADRLQNYTGPELRKLLKWPRPLPLEEERVRLLHEVGLELERSFGGEAAAMLELMGEKLQILLEPKSHMLCIPFVPHRKKHKACWCI